MREALLPDGSDLVAEEMRFRLGWNSTSTTIIIAPNFLQNNPGGWLKGGGELMYRYALLECTMICA